MAFKVPNQYRLRSGRLGSDDSIGNCGAFLIPHPNPISTLTLAAIASSQGGWEHVSVSLPSRCPTWEEMAYVKGLFWEDTDCVIQYHPPRTDYVNNHRYCLHMWRPTGVDLPRPPTWMVGDVSRGVIA